MTHLNQGKQLNMHYCTTMPTKQKNIIRLTDQGFSLVELLTVIAIIAILAAMILPAYNNYLDKTRTKRAAAEIRTLSTEISGYALDRGTYPNTLADINRDQFKDPWKRNYVYRPPSGPNPLMDPLNALPLNGLYDLFSVGKDGISQAAGGAPENKDDIVLFNDGAYIDQREP